MWSVPGRHQGLTYYVGSVLLFIAWYDDSSHMGDIG